MEIDTPYLIIIQFYLIFLQITNTNINITYLYVRKNIN